MFLKNDLQPAVATAAGSYSTRTAPMSDAMMFDTEETGDFRSFHNGGGSDRSRDPRRTPPRRAPKKSVNWKLILLIVAAVAVVAFIAVLAVIFANASTDITYANNSYIVYTDEKDAYHVLVNGDEIEEEFEGEVTLYPSADRSFAYVIDDGSEGVQVYILEGKELERVTPSPVDEVLTFASLKPGVIYRHNQSYRVWSEKGGEQQITKADKNPKNFLLSGDAETVIYSATKEKGETSYEYLYLFAGNVPLEIARNYTPAAISNYGDYIYATVTNSEQGTKDLYYIDPDDKENPVKIKTSAGFDDTLTPVLNVKGDEILFYTSNGSDYSTVLYQTKKDKVFTIGSGVLMPSGADPEIAVCGTFAETYLTEAPMESDDTPSTYFVTKEYKGDEICKFAGRFSPDGDYFYYVNNDDTLMQLDLSDHSRKNTNHEDIIDFAITEKGNIYTLDDSNQLRFYNVSTGKTTAISYDATELSLYNYANTVYFGEEETEDVNVWVSEEGSKQEEAEMDKIEITKIPFFSTPNSKRTYAFYYDAEQGWQLYYTGNGKSFDLISNQCSAIFVDGIEVDND